MDKAEEFMEAFRSLIRGYSAGMRESDQYDGQEEYTGTDYYLQFTDESELNAVELVKVVEEMGRPYR